jgi:non-homologous end joining protein Ku
MPRKLETAHISFGLVTLPVGIYSAIDEQDIHFNQLHAPCGSRIKQQRMSPVCKREVTYDELVKGYEVAKGQYVRLSQEELDQVRAEESEAMTIVEFVPLTAVDPIYYESTYYLAPEGRGDTFAADEYHDEYRQRVLDLIEDKAKGHTITLHPKGPPPVTEVVDLMQRLKDSLAHTAQKRPVRSKALPAARAAPSAATKKAHAGRR